MRFHKCVSLDQKLFLKKCFKFFFLRFSCILSPLTKGLRKATWLLRVNALLRSNVHICSIFISAVDRHSRLIFAFWHFPLLWNHMILCLLKMAPRYAFIAWQTGAVRERSLTSMQMNDPKVELCRVRAVYLWTFSSLPAHAVWFLDVRAFYNILQYIYLKAKLRPSLLSELYDN